MKKINLEPVKKIASGALDLVLYGALLATSYKAAEYVAFGTNNVSSGYDDAVYAIMKSDMFSHHKRDAVSALKRNGNTEFYNAIIHIAKDSSMFSHDKAKMIEHLSGQ
jgi:hypothetical protein